MTDQEQLELDLDLVVEETPTDADFAGWLRSLPPVPWCDEEREQ